MRVLLLGTSNDDGQWFEGGRKRHEILRDLLAEKYGEPVEVLIKAIWPNPGLENVVEGWIEKLQPDVVYMTTNGYWFMYRSVPLRVRRILGPFGKFISDAGFRAAGSPRWSHNAAFRTGRRMLQRSLGGDTHFTADEVADRMCAVIQRLSQAEGILLAIQGCDGRTNYATSKRGIKANERKRLQVDAAMRAFCRERHIHYENTDHAVFRTDRVFAENRVGDGMHANQTAHAHGAEIVFANIDRAIAAQGLVGASGVSATGPEAPP